MDAAESQVFIHCPFTASSLVPDVHDGRVWLETKRDTGVIATPDRNHDRWRTQGCIPRRMIAGALDRRQTDLEQDR